MTPAIQAMRDWLRTCPLVAPHRRTAWRSGWAA